MCIKREIKNLKLIDLAHFPKKFMLIDAFKKKYPEIYKKIPENSHLSLENFNFHKTASFNIATGTYILNLIEIKYVP